MTKIDKEGQLHPHMLIHIHSIGIRLGYFVFVRRKHPVFAVPLWLLARACELLSNLSIMALFHLSPFHLVCLVG